MSHERAHAQRKASDAAMPGHAEVSGAKNEIPVGENTGRKSGEVGVSGTRGIADTATMMPPPPFSRPR